jgi:hypothetical protein
MCSIVFAITIAYFYWTSRLQGYLNRAKVSRLYCRDAVTVSKLRKFWRGLELSKDP